MRQQSHSQQAKGKSDTEADAKKQSGGFQAWLRDKGYAVESCEISEILEDNKAKWQWIVYFRPPQESEKRTSKKISWL